MIYFERKRQTPNLHAPFKCLRTIFGRLGTITCSDNLTIYSHVPSSELMHAFLHALAAPALSMLFQPIYVGLSLVT
jgi:hypothetical protein